MKYALVTASTKGIGKAIGKKLLEENCGVIFNYANNDEDAKKLSEELEEYKGKYEIIKSDLSEKEGVNNLVDKIKKKYGKIDYLILNTAITNRKKLNEITYEEYMKVLDTNLNLPFLTVKELSPFINENGRIIFIGAVMGILPHAMSIPYAVSKAGLRMLAQSLVKEFKDRQITVNTLAPGFVDTPWQLEKSLDHKDRINKKIALNRFGKPEEIAMLCHQIIENQYINGATIRIDGGYDME